MSIIGYLSYYFFYGCGSLFDVTHQEKPAICEPIDTIKLDLLSLLETSYFKTNISPYINKHYQDYGLPIQKKAQDIYNIYGMKGKKVFDQTVAPKVNDFLSNNPFLQEKKSHMYKVYNNQLNPWFKEIQKQYEVVQDTVTKKYHDLPPFVVENIDRLIDLYHKAENTELMPILIKYYWIITDFYNEQLEKLVYRNQYVQHLKAWVNQQEQFQQFYNNHIQPYAALLHKKFHLERLYQHIVSLLPQRPTAPKETVGSSIIETKTPETVHKTIEISITSPVSKAFSSIKEHITKAVPEMPNLSKAFDSIINKEHAATTTTSTTSSATVNPINSLKDKIRNIHPTIPPFRINNKEENDHISDSTQPVLKTEEGNEEVQQQETPIVREEEEILVEQIKQEEIQAENQEVLENINHEQQDSLKVIAQKDVVEVPDEKELFEVHEKEPQSPLIKEESSEKPIILDDVIIIEDQVIIPPPPAATKAAPEEPVDPEEEVILL